MSRCDDSLTSFECTFNNFCILHSICLSVFRLFFLSLVCQSVCFVSIANLRIPYRQSIRKYCYEDVQRIILSFGNDDENKKWMEEMEITSHSQSWFGSTHIKCFVLYSDSFVASVVYWVGIVGVRIIFRVAFRPMFGRSLFRLNGDKTAWVIRLCILSDYVRTTSQRDDDVYSMRYAKTTIFSMFTTEHQHRFPHDTRLTYDFQIYIFSGIPSPLDAFR